MDEMLHQVPLEAEKPNPLGSGHGGRRPQLYKPECLQAVNHTTSMPKVSHCC